MAALVRATRCETARSQQEQQGAVALIARERAALFPALQHDELVGIAHLPFPAAPSLQNPDVKHGLGHGAELRLAVRVGCAAGAGSNQLGGSSELVAHGARAVAGVVLSIPTLLVLH